VFAIVVPCYNEASRFQPNEFRIALEQISDLHLCFVDDGSTDQTSEMLGSFCDEHHPRAVLLNLDSNQGKAEAVRRGLLHIIQEPFTLVGYWDADLSTPLQTTQSFSDVMTQTPSLDMVLGSRIRLLGRKVDRSALRHVLGRVFATFASMALDLPVYDTQCGAKLIRNGPWLVSLLDRPFDSRWAFDVELLSRYLIGCKRNGRTVNLFEFPLDRWSEVPHSKVSLYSSLAAGVVVLRLWRSHRLEMRRIEHHIGHQ